MQLPHPKCGTNCPESCSDEFEVSPCDIDHVIHKTYQCIYFYGSTCTVILPATNARRVQLYSNYRYSNYQSLHRSHRRRYFQVITRKAPDSIFSWPPQANVPVNLDGFVTNQHLPQFYANLNCTYHMVLCFSYDEVAFPSISLCVAKVSAVMMDTLLLSKRVNEPFEIL